MTATKRIHVVLTGALALALTTLLCGAALYSIGSSRARASLPPPAFQLADLEPLLDGDAPWESNWLTIATPFDAGSDVEPQALRAWSEASDVRAATERTEQIERELQRPFADLTSANAALFVQWSRVIHSIAWAHYADGNEARALELLQTLLNRESELLYRSVETPLALMATNLTLQVLSEMGRARGGLPNGVHALVRRLLDEPVDLARAGIFLSVAMRSWLEDDLRQRQPFDLLTLDPEETALLLNKMAVGCAAAARDPAVPSPTVPAGSYASREFNSEGLRYARIAGSECHLGLESARAGHDRLRDIATAILAMPAREARPRSADTGQLALGAHLER